MIGFLRGVVLEKHPDRLLVDVRGVGYELFVSLSTFYGLPDPGAEVGLRVHTHVREDQIALYGFATPLELQLFEKLIAVNGIGPKLALAALSGIEPQEFVRAVRTGDVGRLTSIPGIGKKTAERIGLELRDKLPAVTADVVPGAAGPPPDADLRADLLSALVNLGYQRAPAEKAADAALATGGGAGSFEALLRQALKQLAR